MSLELITSFYISNNENRNKELDYCLKKNLECNFISKIHLFIDNALVLEHLNIMYPTLINNKICIISEYKQPKYSDLFQYANKLKNNLCIICNSDIWFSNDSNVDIFSIIENNMNVIFSLTRYEYDNTKHLIDNYQGSHDAFIFKSPLNIELPKHLNFYQNILGSENVVLYELFKYNYKVYNPCFQIKIIHEHASQIRNYKADRINRGDYDGDNIYKVRSKCAPPIFIQ
jgi:hypothetical protein